MNLQIFINESSLHGQYTKYDVENNIKCFLSTINFINNQLFNTNVYTTQLFFDVSQAIQDRHIGAILEKNFNLKNVFFSNIKSVSKWENERVHDPSVCYIYNEEDYAGKSIAELAERKLQNHSLKDLLINFPNSKFIDKTNIEVCKDNTCNVLLNCSFDTDSVCRFFIFHKLIDPNQEYDTNSNFPPGDHQTVLKDRGKFSLTTYKNQNRKVYERIDHNELWTVDNFHCGKDAHIEIFNKTTKKHLGTSPYNEILLDPRYKEKGRKLI